MSFNIPAVAAWFCAAALAFVSTASALPTCQGTYAATSILPLPAKPLVDLDVRDRSPRNVRLATRFLAGLREAGVAVGGQPNVVLHVSTSRLGGTPGQSGPVAALRQAIRNWLACRVAARVPSRRCRQPPLAALGLRRSSRCCFCASMRPRERRPGFPGLRRSSAGWSDRTRAGWRRISGGSLVVRSVSGSSDGRSDRSFH